MTLSAVVCAALAAVLLSGPAAGAVRVRAILRHQSARSQGSAQPDGERADHGWTRPRRAVVVGCAVVAGVSLVGGVPGMVLGVGLGAVSWFGLGRMEPRSRARERERIAGTVPLAADLLAAALTAGCPPQVAVDAVGSALDGPLGRSLVDAGTSANVGADPRQAWAPLMREPSARALARALAVAMSRGTSPVPALRRAAHDARDEARWAGEARARSLGARAAAPLGLCFLPAFVLVGIVPIVATSGALMP